MSAVAAALAGADPAWSWDLTADVRQMWSYPFMVTAFRAGTVVAVTAGAVGWFMVLRRQSFAGHTLAVVGFPGAAGAALVGVGTVYGYVVFCVLAAVAVAAVPGGGGYGGSRDAADGAQAALIGTVQAFVLACGFWFTALYPGLLGGVTSLLFGDFLGISGTQAWTLLAVAVAVLALLACIGRPLLLASVDPQAAAASGVRVRLVSAAFLVLLGAASAGAGRITGALLVFALLVMPAAAAQALTDAPRLSLALSVLIAVAVTWAGLTAAFYSPYPIGFWVTTFAFGVHLTARLARPVTARLRAGGARAASRARAAARGGCADRDQCADREQYARRGKCVDRGQCAGRGRA